MRFSLLAMIALASGAISQTTEDPGPSPTASVGCEPHGDHWYGIIPEAFTSRIFVSC